MIRSARSDSLSIFLASKSGSQAMGIVSTQANWTVYDEIPAELKERVDGYSAFSIHRVALMALDRCDGSGGQVQWPSPRLRAMERPHPGVEAMAGRIFTCPCYKRHTPLYRTDTEEARLLYPMPNRGHRRPAILVVSNLCGRPGACSGKSSYPRSRAKRTSHLKANARMPNLGFATFFDFEGKVRHKGQFSQMPNWQDLWPQSKANVLP